MTNEQQYKGESDHCRYRLMKYCRGQGLDLGCGFSKIRIDAIGIDINNSAADMNCDAQLLEQYPKNCFNYIFSSHLLEEIDNTEATLREWLRVIKPNGNIVLYQADKNLYYPIGHPLCNNKHKHHFSWEDLWEIFKRIGGVKLVHHGLHTENKEWSFELVVKKTVDDKEMPMTGEGISILIPTYNRPHNMETFAISVDRTAKYPESIEIVFGVHEDDRGSIDKAIELQSKCNIKIRYELINRFPDGKINLSYLWNQIYIKAANPIIGFYGDDVVFHTPGWDEEVRLEFTADKTIMVCTNDIHEHQGRSATLFFTHKCVHDKLGLYLDERFRRWYCDTYWDVIYKSAGKFHYREDLVTEHLKGSHFPEKADQVYKNMEMFKDQDAAIFYSPTMNKEIGDKIEILKSFKPE